MYVETTAALEKLYKKRERKKNLPVVSGTNAHSAHAVSPCRVLNCHPFHIWGWIDLFLPAERFKGQGLLYIFFYLYAFLAFPVYIFLSVTYTIR